VNIKIDTFIFIIFLQTVICGCTQSVKLVADNNEKSVIQTDCSYHFEINAISTTIPTELLISTAKSKGMISLTANEGYGKYLKKVDEPTKLILDMSIKDFSKLSSLNNPKGLKRSIIVKFKEPTQYLYSGVLIEEKNDSENIYEYYGLLRRIKRVQTKNDPFLFCTFSYGQFLSSINALLSQDQIILSGEKIIVLNRFFTLLKPEIFSLGELVKK